MIIRGSELPAPRGRKDYGIGRYQDEVKHFVEWLTAPESPFGPHKHERLEFWYILEGEAIVALEGQESRLAPGDLVVIAPWVDHGLRSESATRWICFG